MNRRLFFMLFAVVVFAAAGFPAAPVGSTAAQSGGGIRDTKILQQPGAVCDWSKLAVGANCFFALCYHDVVPVNEDDRYAVQTAEFVKQIEFLRHEGFTFISVDDLLVAKNGGQPLPPKAVLLSVDDAYLSFHTQIFPILKAYRIPCVLAVVSEWIERPPDDPEYNKPFLNWEQIQELSASGLVEIAGHTHNLHHDIVTDPLGSTAAALVSRTFCPSTNRYETEAEYLARIGTDLQTSAATLLAKTGKLPRVIVWPYGHYNDTAIAQAKQAGFRLCLSLDDGLGSVDKLERIPRHMLEDNPRIEIFSRNFRDGFPEYAHQRIIHADLDELYSPDPTELTRNIDHFVERMFLFKPTTVYLQAFADPDSSGNVAETYFPNSVLPMRADLFGRVCRALSIHGIEVYAWMPMLSYQFPGENVATDLRVREFHKGQKAPQLSTSWYHRASPFAPAARQKILALFADLARNCPLDGILFQDDAYLNDFEDFHPAALAAYLKITGGAMIPPERLPEAQKDAWTDAKTKQLTAFALEICDTVRQQRPTALFARTIYAPVILDPASEEWLAQNYDDTIRNFDFAVVMAYPYMEGAFFHTAWLRNLVATAAKHPGAMNKTVFKIQAYDWAAHKPVPSATVNAQLRVLLAAGARHVAYYPDSLFDDHPQLTVVRQTIGSRDIPFDPREPEPKRKIIPPVTPATPPSQPVATDINPEVSAGSPPAEALPLPPPATGTPERVK